MRWRRQLYEARAPSTSVYFLVTSEFTAAAQTLSLFHWTLRGCLPGQKVYRPVVLSTVTVYCMNGCQHKIIFS